MMLLPVGRMYIRMESAMSIIVDKISYVYEAGTGFERRALDNVSCAINDGEFVGLIGHTGSGKSTFIQHLRRQRDIYILMDKIYMMLDLI